MPETHPARSAGNASIRSSSSAHLQQILAAYAVYYNELRTHLSLASEIRRAIGRSGASANSLLSQSSATAPRILSDSIQQGQRAEQTITHEPWTPSFWSSSNEITFPWNAAGNLVVPT